MYKRIIALLMMVIAGGLVLASAGSTAHAESASDQVQSKKEPKMITVNQGDYLDKLAQENGTTYLRLFYANEEISDPDLIYPSMKLRVPEAGENLTPRPLPENVPAIEKAEVAPTTQAAPTEKTASAPVQTQAVVMPTGTTVWDQLASCESGGNWAINTGNEFYGGLQFTLSSWQAVGGSGYPNQASRDEQIYRAQLLQARQGWGAWPACSAKLGLL